VRLRHFAVALCLLGALPACTPTFSGRLRTRDPFEEKKLETYRSGTIAFGLGDVDVRGYGGANVPLAQTAWFEIVSEQEIRFHIMLSHKNEDMTDLQQFEIRLFTDRGHELAPTSVWTRRKMVEGYDQSVTTIKQSSGAHPSPGYLEEVIRRDLHGADTVIVFKQPGLVAKNVRSYKLMLDSKKRRFRFIWDIVPKAELADEE
jgi:hypothetical protein